MRKGRGKSREAVAFEQPLRSADHPALKQLKIITDGHGEGQQFFESLLRFVKLDRDAAGFEAHTGGEVLKLLIHDGCRCFDQ
jgi:hypothetical protein